MTPWGIEPATFHLVAQVINGRTLKYRKWQSRVMGKF